MSRYLYKIRVRTFSNSFCIYRDFDKPGHDGEGHESLAADNAVFKELALIYARHHPLMSKGIGCPHDYFENGITNGAHWYELAGKQK